MGVIGSSPTNPTNAEAVVNQGFQRFLSLKILRVNALGDHKMPKSHMKVARSFSETVDLLGFEALFGSHESHIFYCAACFAFIRSIRSLFFRIPAFLAGA